MNTSLHLKTPIDLVAERIVEIAECIGEKSNIRIDEVIRKQESGKLSMIEAYVEIVQIMKASQ